MTVSSKRTIRSWASRRVNNAFTAALAKSGYGPDGLSLSRVSGTSEFDLKGSMRLVLNKKIIEAPMDLVEKEAMTLVDYLCSPHTRQKAHVAEAPRILRNERWRQRMTTSRKRLTAEDKSLKSDAKTALMGSHYRFR